MVFIARLSRLPRPIVERLGGDFFRQLPEQPGVYLMRDARVALIDVVLECRPTLRPLRG